MINDYYYGDKDDDNEPIEQHELRKNWSAELPGAPPPKHDTKNGAPVPCITKQRKSSPAQAGSNNNSSCSALSANGGVVLMGSPFDTCSATAPIVIAGKKWSYRLSISSMLPDETGAQTLRDTFEIVKKYADEVALQGMQCIFDRVPEAAEIFSKAGRIRHVDDEWEMVQMGRLFLSAIEKCISRINNPNMLRSYLAQLTKIHNRRGVHSTEIPVALHAFESAILRCLRPHHQHIESRQLSSGNLLLDDNGELRRNSAGEQSANSNHRNSSGSNGGQIVISVTTTEKVRSNSTSASTSTSPNNSGDNNTNNGVCFVCSTWRNFMDVLNVLMVTDMKE